MDDIEEAITKQWKICTDCSLTAAERQVIEPYKHEIQSKVGRDARSLVFKTKICPAMFNFWASTNPKMGEAERDQRLAVSCVLSWSIIAD